MKVHAAQNYYDHQLPLSVAQWGLVCVTGRWISNVFAPSTLDASSRGSQGHYHYMCQSVIRHSEGNQLIQLFIRSATHVPEINVASEDM